MNISTTQHKKLRTYLENVSELILKAKLKLHQLERIDPEEIVIILTNAEIASL